MLLALPVLLACSESTVPTIVAYPSVGRYRLVAIDGQPLPTLVTREEACPVLADTGVLVLRLDGFAALEYRGRQQCPPQRPELGDTIYASYPAVYTVHGDSLRFLTPVGTAASFTYGTLITYGASVAVGRIDVRLPTIPDALPDTLLLRFER